MNFRGISDKELKAIESYRKTFCENDTSYLLDHKMRDFAPAEKWLIPWETQKNGYLFQLFGEGNLILKKKISFHRELVGQMVEFLQQRTAKELYNSICDAIRKQYMNEYGVSACNTCRDDIFYHLFDAHNLSTNRFSEMYKNDNVSIHFPDGERIPLQYNAKVSKVLGKVAQKLGVEGYEKFRIAHSIVLNNKKTEGTLCLSIHPLDYMTMSDNENGWSSCMSWQKDGCYKMGTIEMMNSPCVVVAYVEDKENKMQIGSYDNCIEWNSKKWRSLFIVSDQLISNIKGYPYQLEDVDHMVIDWLAELAEQNLGWTYALDGEFDPDDDWTIGSHISYCICTDYMYNDYYCGNRHFVKLREKKDIEEDINISGPAECAWCGSRILFDPDDFSAEYLVCMDCHSFVYCDNCGSREYAENIIEAEIDDEPHCLCRECYNNNFLKVVNNTERVHRNRVNYFYIFPKELRPYVENKEVHSRILVNECIGMRFAYDVDKPIDDFMRDIGHDPADGIHIIATGYFSNKVFFLYSDEVNDNVVKYDGYASGNIAISFDKDDKLYFDRLWFAINDSHYLFSDYDKWFEYISIVREEAVKAVNLQAIDRIDHLIEHKQEIKDKESWLWLS